MADIVLHDESKVASFILSLRGKRVMLDKDLALLYGVTTGNLNKAVKRNAARFPEDFMFQLSQQEFEALRFHFGSSKGRGGIRYMPYAFTEQGVSMLSAVLNSSKAVEVSIIIMRAFVRLRQILAENAALRYAVEGLEKRMDKNERDIQIAIRAIQSILNAPQPAKPQRKMGFCPPEKKQ